MKSECLKVFCIGLFATGVLTGCNAGNAESRAAVTAEYTEEIEAFRAERLARLKAEDGYLNLAGLFWLEEGSYRFGAADDNDIIFPPAAGDYVGTFELTPDGVVMTALPDSNAMFEGERVESILMRDDTTESPVTVTQGSLAWVAVLRAGRYAIRLRDLDHPALEALPPIPQFDIAPEYRVVGRLKRYAEPRIASVKRVIEGLDYNPESPGVVEFEIDGQTMELEAYTVGDRLFFIFGDLTSGRETYPAGRFLYAAQANENGLTVLDFNKSYNPPCAFGDFSTCPVASPRNRLSVRIPAGEKFDPALHVTSLVYEHAGD